MREKYININMRPTAEECIHKSNTALGERDRRLTWGWDAKRARVYIRKMYNWAIWQYRE